MIIGTIMAVFMLVVARHYSICTLQAGHAAARQYNVISRRSLLRRTTEVNKFTNNILTKIYRIVHFMNNSSVCIRCMLVGIITTSKFVYLLFFQLQYYFLCIL